MSSGLEIVILAVILIILLFYWENWKPKNYPDGPVRFPFLGNVPQILWINKVQKEKRYKAYIKYAKKYGSMFSLNLASYRAVVISDPKIIKEAYANYQFCGRPKLHGTAERTGGVNRGILFQDGEEWLEQRRFALRHLKDFGFGKRSMENLVMDEALELIEGFKKDLGQPISTQNRFNIAVLNSLWSIVTGQRFSHDDQQLKHILESIYRSLNFQGLVFFIPWLKNIAPKWSGWDDYVASLPATTEFVRKFVEKRLKEFEGGEPEHFTDAYINEMRKTTDPQSSFYKERGEETLVATLLDLFVAGAETTSTTLTYTFLYLALFPDKQKKIHEEIDRCLGSRYPTLEDRSKMPYTEAVILETLRYSSMVPLGIIHTALSDAELGGYLIPKNTFLIANLHSVHHNPQIWGDPSNFRPERFLSSDQLQVIRHESLIAFSFGKRLCLGETLAKDELFLFISSIFQQFVVTADPSSPKLTTEQLSTNIIAPPVPHKLVLSLRKTVA